MLIHGSLPLLLALEIHGKAIQSEAEVKVAQLAQGILAVSATSLLPVRVALMGGVLVRGLAGHPMQPRSWESVVSISCFILNSLAFMNLAPRLLFFAGVGPLMATTITLMGLYSRFGALQDAQEGSRLSFFPQRP